MAIIATLSRLSVSELDHNQGEMGGKSPSALPRLPLAFSGLASSARAGHPSPRPRAPPSPAPSTLMGRAGSSEGRLGPEGQPLRLEASAPPQRSLSTAQPLSRGTAPQRSPIKGRPARGAAPFFMPCPPGDLNPHDRSHWNLNPARLPSPPGGQTSTLGRARPDLGRARPEQSTHNGVGPCRPRPCSPPSGDCWPCP